uniref:Uncharacterized protein n=1 Tax=Arundo donax TaxID=35708 RepID=A0A0A9BJY3_ARUDO
MPNRNKSRGHAHETDPLCSTRLDRHYGRIASFLCDNM